MQSRGGVILWLWLEWLGGGARKLVRRISVARHSVIGLHSFSGSFMPRTIFLAASHITRRGGKRHGKASAPHQLAGSGFPLCS
jgi:hypothetical protein